MNSFKKNILAATVLISLTTVNVNRASAQMGEFGIRFMPTISSLALKTSTGGAVSGKASIGFGAGVLLGFNFSQNVGLHAEVIYNTLSQKYTDTGMDRTITLRYVNIPLLLSLNTGISKPVNLNVVVGPQIGLSVGSKLSSTTASDANTTQAVLAVKKGDLGFAYGLGLDFGMNATGSIRFALGYRGVIGLVDISDNSKTTTTDSFYVLDKTHVKTYSGYAGITFLF
ncbi:MAG: PorT family protein [Bacteroidetes bacterium]|nr:PorT family protein [Bacteroidota bacterium]